MGLAKGCCRRFRDAEVADLALVDELRHGAPGLLDGDGGVDAVLVVEIDVVDSQPRERSVAGGPHVFGTSVDADPAAVGAALVAEFGCEDNFIAPAGDCLADEQLIGERPVHVSSVEEVDADLECAMNRCDRFVVVPRSIRLAHSHAAETDGRDLERSPENSCLHDDSPVNTDWSVGPGRGVLILTTVAAQGACLSHEI